MTATSELVLLLTLSSSPGREPRRSPACRRMANQFGPPKEQGDQALLARVVMENLTGRGSLKVRILLVLLCVPFYLRYP